MADLDRERMVAAVAAELEFHRGISAADHWWCECGAAGWVESQDESDRAISHHMAGALLDAADRGDAAAEVLRRARGWRTLYDPGVPPEAYYYAERALIAAIDAAYPPGEEARHGDA